VDGTFSTVGLGVGKIGGIAATRTPLVVPSLRGDEEWLANPAWISRQGVRSFEGYPLAAGDHLLGVMAIFDRGRPSTADLEQHEFFARFVALRLIALRERDALTSRLATLETHRRDDDSPRAVLEPPRTIITRSELRIMERDTVEAALNRTGGRVFGARGAAILLGMKPTTLASRMKALGIPSSRVIRRRVKDERSLGDRSQSDNA
jgi:transcriptional regulator with GAF, ATPase, and Fis domain